MVTSLTIAKLSEGKLSQLEAKDFDEIFKEAANIADVVTSTPCKLIFIIIEL